MDENTKEEIKELLTHLVESSSKPSETSLPAKQDDVGEINTPPTDSDGLLLTKSQIKRRKKKLSKANTVS